MEPPPDRDQLTASPFPPARGTAWARGAPFSELSRLAAVSLSPASGRSGSLSRRPGSAGLVRSPSATSPLIPTRLHPVTGQPHGSQLIVQGIFDLPCRPYAALEPLREAPPGWRAPTGPPAPQPETKHPFPALSSGWRQGVTPPSRQPPLREAAGRYAPERLASPPQPPSAEGPPG